MTDPKVLVLTLGSILTLSHILMVNIIARPKGFWSTFRELLLLAWVWFSVGSYQRL